MNAIEQRALATDHALRRRADELTGHRRELAERSRRLGTELAEVRVLASAELAAGLRRLRDDARVRLARPDHRYPRLLADAVAELGRRYLCRTHELTQAAAARALVGLDAGPPRLPAREWTPPTVTPPPRRGRWPAEERVIAVAAVSGGVGLARLAWVGGFPAPLAAGAAVSLGLAAACWLASARRAGAERARLTQWTGEVLADTRGSLEATFARRLLDTERVARAVLDQLVTRLDGQVATHERAVRGVLARRRAAAR